MSLQTHSAAKRASLAVRTDDRNGHRSHGLCMIRRTASMWTVPEEEAVDTDYRPISYDSVGLYFPIVQIIAANIAVAGVVMASSVVLPNYASATRSLLLATTAAVIILRKPLRVGKTRGVATLFTVSRPCTLLPSRPSRLFRARHTQAIIETARHALTHALTHPPAPPHAWQPPHAPERVR